MSSSSPLAIAVDLGTTTIAASLVETGTGRRLAMTGGLNPQSAWGKDVITRLSAALHRENLVRMQQAIGEQLELFARELLAAAGVRSSALQLVAVAGNPAMEHLLLGLPVESLAFPPYRPLFSAGRLTTTAQLGWREDIPAYLFPLPGGFVGGDTVAFLHGVDRSGCRLFLDLGTNGEICLAAEGKLLATSAAAGPAMEGGNLSCGMPALAGAVSHVAVDRDRVAISTIGNGRPAGICGSGVISAIAGLLAEGALDATGRLLPSGEIGSNLANRIIQVAGEPAFSIYRDAGRSIHLTQEDIRQVQLAKGAIRAGMEVLFDRAAISAASLEEVVLTGSFGAVLSPEELKSIGIFTGNMVKITRFLPEGALSGTEHAACLRDGFASADSLAATMKVIPLSGTPLFEKHFLRQLDFR